jgi:hypothetical protein
MSSSAELDRLLAILQEIAEELKAVQARYQAVSQAVLEERFRDMPQFAKGDIILVPRKLFGRIRMWPAKVESVNLHFIEGNRGENYEPDPGGHWESKSVSYTVFLKHSDGEFSGSSQGFYHSEVAPLPRQPGSAEIFQQEVS